MAKPTQAELDHFMICQLAVTEGWSPEDPRWDALSVMTRYANRWGASRARGEYSHGDAIQMTADTMENVYHPGWEE